MLEQPTASVDSFLARGQTHIEKHEQTDTCFAQQGLRAGNRALAVVVPECSEDASTQVNGKVGNLTPAMLKTLEPMVIKMCVSDYVWNLYPKQNFITKRLPVSNRNVFSLVLFLKVIGDVC